MVMMSYYSESDPQRPQQSMEVTSGGGGGGSVGNGGGGEDDGFPVPSVWRELFLRQLFINCIT